MLGYLWLSHHFDLPTFALPHASRLGTRAQWRENADGSVEETYPSSYAVADDPVAHLVFALKYDGVHPQVLQASFKALGRDALAAAIQAKPTSKYLRLLGFWHEWLLCGALPCGDSQSGAYIPALSPLHYICRSEGDLSFPLLQRNTRWRVIDNSLGWRGWCPFIRRSAAIQRGMKRDDSPLLAALSARYPPALFQRASNYLYLKETRSSWNIEREQPSAERTERFVEVLKQAGANGDALHLRLSEHGLTALQNQIVDPRYAENGFRKVQNFIGETRAGGERVHYICPPPELAHALMYGWSETSFDLSLLELHPVVSAALCAFGFVFIHPFEDGNGRLHRYLIHEILRAQKWGLPGFPLPLSATILRRLPEYDAALEAYSKPIQRLAKHEFEADHRLKVLNAEELESSWRWPDLTRQVEFLFETIDHCLREDLPQELAYLMGYDRARESLRDIVDMPDRKMDLLLRLLHQNDGTLSKPKRAQFAEITDAELQQMEAAYQQAMASAAFIAEPELPL